MALMSRSARGLRCAAAQHRVEDLAAHAAADDPGNGVADRAEALVLHDSAGCIAANRAGNKLNYELCDVHVYPP